MNITKYILSSHEYIQINPNECIHEDECQFCANIDIDYIDEKNNIYIRFGYEFADEFYLFLTKSKIFQKLLNGTHTLDSSITTDVGLEWNDLFAGKRGPTKASQYHWVSNDHKHIPPYYSSWFYNDEKGNIIFEITPNYPWHNITKKTNPEKISYKEWIKDYKPTAKTIIPKENLQQWIKQAHAFGKKYNLIF